MNVLKRSICMLLVAVMVLSLVACAAKTATPTTEAPAEKTTEAVATTETASADTAEETTAVSTEETEAEDAPVILNVMGYDVVFEKAPERVAIGNMENAAILVALGLEDKIVGYTNGHFKIEEFPEEFQPALSRLHLFGSDATFETILAEDIDFVFGSSWHFNDDGLAPAKDCIANNIGFYCISSGVTGMATMDLFYEDILNLGKIFRIEDRAEAYVAEMKAEMDDIAAEAATLKEHPTVLMYDNGDKEAMVAGNNCLQARQLEIAGGVNIFADMDSTYPDVSWEEIAARNPQWILINEYEDENWTTTKEEFLKNNPALQEVDAVKNDRFISIKLSALRESPSVVAGTRAILEAFKAAEAE